eukprot:TRINITY_DN6135_c0_g1_i1.p1 TRINITY_DN6135_c0_g1~~TRINITY_DN6135_c0_g1_i1.p1  ORF type:complete len:165 (+),score=41.65 TRINITY_DN6135_c0_g1_i1:62-496(+)
MCIRDSLVYASTPAFLLWVGLSRVRTELDELEAAQHTAPAPAEPAAEIQAAIQAPAHTQDAQVLERLLQLERRTAELQERLTVATQPQQSSGAGGHRALAASSLLGDAGADLCAEREESLEAVPAGERREGLSLIHISEPTRPY